MPCTPGVALNQDGLNPLYSTQALSRARREPEPSLLPIGRFCPKLRAMRKYYSTSLLGGLRCLPLRDGGNDGVVCDGSVPSPPGSCVGLGPVVTSSSCETVFCSMRRRLTAGVSADRVGPMKPLSADRFVTAATI